MILSSLSRQIIPVRKAFDSKSLEVIELGFNELSHSLALSLKEKGNSLSLIASRLTPFILKVSQISKNEARWALGSSEGNPTN